MIIYFLCKKKAVQKDQEAIMKKKQFDEFLGGFQSLPHEVSVMNFVSSRAHEISAMTSSIGML